MIETRERRKVWAPQPGPQTAAAVCPCDITLFGGTRGGGKSDCLLGRQNAGAQQYRSHWNGLIIRRKYKDFTELRRRIDEMITEGLPAERIGGENQVNYIRFHNGGRYILAAVMRSAMLTDFVGQQFTEIAIEEGTTLPFFYQAVDRLSGSLRSPHGVPCRMFVTGNPGGPGHAQVKEMLVDPAPPGRVFRNSAGQTCVFIRSTLADNRILCRNDPDYVRRLQAIRDPALREAWLEGNWDIFLGQAFAFMRRYHVVEPIEIPQGAPLYFSFDWGHSRPFSVGWWWVDNDNRLYRFDEWYGWDGTPEKGLRLTDSQIAEGIIERERKLGIDTRAITRFCGHDCFARRPDYFGQGLGPSTAEVFARHGLVMQPGDATREQKIRQFRERLRVDFAKNGADLAQRPMLVVYSNCTQFIRTIPAIPVDEQNAEDVDTDSEDHIYDETCHVCMARQLKIRTEPVPCTQSVGAWFRRARG